MHRCSIRIRLSCESPIHIASALEPEAGTLPGKRSRATINVEDGYLIMTLEAEDTTALRAAINSFLRWYSAIAKSLETISMKGK